MSPIRPSLLTLRPRWPRPQQQRHVRCPGCGCEIHVSRRALSTRCPRCTGPLHFQDYTLRDKQRGELATLGEIHIVEACTLSGRLICGRLISAGEFHGSATVHGQVELHPTSRTTGDLVAQSLTVQRGAQLHARTSIGAAPDAAPRPRVGAGNRLIPD